MTDVEIRDARDSEFAIAAHMRWTWVIDAGGTPVATYDEYIEFFTRWAREHHEGHLCSVAVRGDRVIGMAWLATVPRVPSPRSLERYSGDVQCVYVVPEERNNGVGGLLLDRVLVLAAEKGMERVTVHSSPRAVTAYQRAGFGSSEQFLQVAVG